MGKMPILNTEKRSENAWEPGHKTPDFFVIADDMYGNSVRVEADCTLVKPTLLYELLTLLEPLRDWSVYLALIKGGLWIFTDRILFEGNLFLGCRSVTDLHRRCVLDANP